MDGNDSCILAVENEFVVSLAAPNFLYHVVFDTRARHSPRFVCCCSALRTLLTCISYPFEVDARPKYPPQNSSSYISLPKCISWRWLDPKFGFSRWRQPKGIIKIKVQIIQKRVISRFACETPNG